MEANGSVCLSQGLWEENAVYTVAARLYAHSQSHPQSWIRPMEKYNVRILTV